MQTWDARCMPRMHPEQLATIAPAGDHKAHACQAFTGRVPRQREGAVKFGAVLV